MLTGQGEFERLSPAPWPQLLVQELATRGCPGGEQPSVLIGITAVPAGGAEYKYHLCYFTTKCNHCRSKSLSHFLHTLFGT